MEDDDDSDFVGDFLCERAETLRGIAADLDTRKNRDARKILIEAATCLLQHMHPPSARIIALVPDEGKAVKEKPL